ncbi:thermostable alkaline protease precursor protein [Pleurostoma richardsiae]|uniref:Thermostable alkaline protease protein n=1 Tax=Pleurostoma richardsiae TaxID=41990 RepID=A0AA38S7B6_9PEZI|nr:thermostable alkaline protease precursor protein [Pleurostoma richardsiae]
MEEEEDVIEFAQKALKSVSFIAIQQGLDKRSSLHAEVGAELFILASSLDDAVWDHEARVRQRVFKLLRDVEHICRWPQKPLANDLSYLEAVAFAPPGSKGYTVAECNIIKGLEAFVSEDHRLNQELQQLEEWEPRKQLVERLPGIPLTTILRQYRLTNRMKVALAYIIARSMWQFYGSDWMKTKWTSETIYFMSELCSVPHDGSTGVFAWKPYFSVRFGEADANFDEFSSFDGEIHRNPRVLALGVMLVEIGMGIPIREAEDGLDRQTLTAKMNEGESPDPQDTDGHGTYMVSLIMRVAPHADVYVARVAKDSKSLLDAGPNVAKAIEWAHSEWDVDIISMSFGFEEAKLPIKKAIHRVLNERDDGVLLFAAASNSGANAREMFPARHESVISIRATNARQDFADFNPPRAEHDGIVFGTLGLNVPSASLGDQSGEEFKSGTSVATAVAVGIAGVALEYVFRRPNMPGFEVLKGKLGTRNGMMAMFKAMATRTMNEGYYYVAPWRLEGGSDDERWALFVAALRDVL